MVARIIYMDSRNNYQKISDSKTEQVHLNNKKYINENIEKLYKESERRVAEYGNFQNVKTRFKNKVKELDIKDVEICIKPSILLKERPKERELEISIKSANDKHKYVVVLKRGEKEEILKFLQSKDAVESIESAMQDASDSFSEIELY